MRLQIRRQEWAASALVGSGFTRWTRQRQLGQAAVLTFHGLSAPGSIAAETLDASLHEPVASFRETCRHLSQHYDPLPLSQIAAAAANGEPIRTPRGRPAIGLTFDDGYASNLHLALPVLEEFELHATVFVTTQFIEGELLWFHKVDLLLLAANQGRQLTLSHGDATRHWHLGTPIQRSTVLCDLLGWMKTLPASSLPSLLASMESQLQIHCPPAAHAPTCLQPLTWKQLRLLESSPWVEIGGHTHSHPILSRCSEAEIAREITHSTTLLRRHLTTPPVCFAYPNGGLADFPAATCARELEMAGYTAAFTTQPAHVSPASLRWTLPRYGAPVTLHEAEATASGAFETLKRWRHRPLQNSTSTPNLPERKTLLHFIARIDGGGAEAMLRNLVQRTNRSQWRIVVVAMDTRMHTAQAQLLRGHCDALHDLQCDAFLRRDTLAKLIRLLRDEQPHLIQTWMHHADLIGGLAARWAGFHTILWSIHCREIHRSPGESPLKLALFKQVLRLTSRWLPAHIVSCSQVALQDHTHLGYPRKKLTWIPNGIDTQRFRPDPLLRSRERARLGIDDDAPLIGFVGRLHEMKNLPALLTAFAEVQRRLPQAHLALCGIDQADLYALHPALLAALPAPSQLHCLPFRPDPEAFYPALDLFTLSSRTEACPMTLLEAMACGVPCVTTDVGDCRLLLDTTGTVVPEGNPTALALALLARLSAPASDHHNLALAARTRVVDHFSIDLAANTYGTLYHELTEVSA